MPASDYCYWYVPENLVLRKIEAVAQRSDIITPLLVLNIKYKKYFMNIIPSTSLVGQCHYPTFADEETEGLRH